jgi:hypothetical protein
LAPPATIEFRTNQPLLQHGFAASGKVQQLQPNYSLKRTAAGRLQ